MEVEAIKDIKKIQAMKVETRYGISVSTKKKWTPYTWI
jgi:hypothetical protein